jgi:hypothetical protein
MLNSNKMVTCTFCRIKGFKHISSECVFNKWKKEREFPAMIRRPKVRIPELVMQRQNPTDTRDQRGARNIDRNCKKPENRSAELQRRQ